MMELVLEAECGESYRTLWTAFFAFSLSVNHAKSAFSTTLEYTRCRRNAEKLPSGNLAICSRKSTNCILAVRHYLEIRQFYQYGCLVIKSSRTNTYDQRRKGRRNSRGRKPHKHEHHKIYLSSHLRLITSILPISFKRPSMMLLV